MTGERIFKPGVEAEFVPTREGYDRWAAIYDVEDNPLIQLEEPVVNELMGDVRGLQVLDLGCGTGRHSLRLAAAGAHVTAVDFSDGMVARAAAKPGWERIRFVAHDLAQPLPFDDAAFDRVASFLVLEHIVRLDPFFRECRRVCRSGGCMIATTLHPAMMLRGIQAHFNDPASGRDVCPQSLPHQLSDFVIAIAGSGLTLDHMREHAVSEALAAANPRAAKYRGWPMLVTFRARA